LFRYHLILIKFSQNRMSKLYIVPTNRNLEDMTFRAIQF
jgi:hypothetical protein